MPRKSRKDLVEVNEEESQVNRESLYRRLEYELHTEWRAARAACLSGASPEVTAYPSAL